MVGFGKNENKKSRSQARAAPKQAERVFKENRKRTPKTVKEKRRPKRASLGPKLPPAKRVLSAVVRLVFASIVTGCVLLLGVLAYRHATESDYFAFRTLNLTGNKRLTKATIAETAGLIDGKNIFKIDLARAKRDLLNHPWISDAEIMRRLPDLIAVKVVEREAVALVNLDVLYLVDDMGRVFKRWAKGDPLPSPVITGISREHYIEHPKQVEMMLCDAVDLSNRYKSSALQKLAPLDEIHREADGGFALTAGADPVYIKFGRGPYRKKLARLSTMMARLAREGGRPAIIFFDNEVRPDRITVKMKPDQMTTNINFQNGFGNDAKKKMSKI